MNVLRSLFTYNPYIVACGGEGVPPCVYFCYFN